MAEIQHTLKPISEDERKDLELKTQQMTKPEAGQETEQGAERATAKKTKQHASPKKRDIEHQTQKEIDTMRKMIEIYCRGQLLVRLSGLVTSFAMSAPPYLSMPCHVLNAALIRRRKISAQIAQPTATSQK